MRERYQEGWQPSAELEERLKRAVACRFPFQDGENFDGWASRARNENHGRRALLAATAANAPVAPLTRHGCARNGQPCACWFVVVGKMLDDPPPLAAVFLLDNFGRLSGHWCRFFSIRSEQN